MAKKLSSNNKKSKNFAPDKVIKAKDPKKVLAGKMRQATGIKDASGKYVSKIFTNEIKKTLLATKKVDVSKIAPDQSDKIDQLLKEAKISPKQIKSFYTKNKEIFDDLKTFGKLKGTSKNSNQIEKTIDTYKGKIFLNNGKEVIEVSKAEAKFNFLNFKNLLSSNINLVEFYVRPTLSLDGTMTINLPDAKEFRKKIKEYFGITNLKQLEEIEPAEIQEAVQKILQDMFGEEDTDLFLIIS
jgi:hypothetical protein